ncbi:MAG: hypothetical protein KAZ98_01610 [Prevotella sp.]|nr:hypothetical protein [Prevotella sp.]
MTEDHIDRVQTFLDSLQKLGNQLKAAEEQQGLYLGRMLELKRQGLTEETEYADLDARSKQLQQLIDKYRPMYLERMEMVCDATPLPHRKRTKKK